MENFIELLKTTLVKKVEMSFGYFFGTLLFFMCLTFLACMLGFLLAF